MSDQVTVYLPLNTQVYVQAFANASLNQQVTITQESGTSTTLTGSGNNAPMTNSPFTIATPGQSESPLGYRVTVVIESANGSGQNQPSQVSSGSCGVKYYSLIAVAAAVNINSVWNDALVQFSWWTPPVS